MIDSAPGPDLRHLLPLSHETRWSDLLATLIETDAAPMVGLLDLAESGGITTLDVRREVPAPGPHGRSDILDILLSEPHSKHGIAAIEVKVLSGPGPDQLSRYCASFSHTRSHRLVHLEGLGFDLSQTPCWNSLTWESILSAYSESSDAWVATTARAWLDYIAGTVPPITSDTAWNAVPDDATGFAIAMHARMCWLHDRMSSWCNLEHDLVMSAAGRSWVARMSKTAAAAPGHLVACEIEEGLPVRDRGEDASRPLHDRVVGPSIWVGMRQESVPTSADFAWDHLLHIFRETVLDTDNNPVDGRHWRRSRPGLRHQTDKANWQRSVESRGGPVWLGKGFGMAQAKAHDTCMFGARYMIDPSSTLHQIDSELQRLARLIDDMAAVSAASQSAPPVR